MVPADIDALILDMDGVLWRGDEALPGLVPFFEFLRLRQIPFMLATNNSSRPPEQYIAKLAAMGVSGVDPRHIVTSSTATAVYLQAHYPPQTRVYVVGMEGVREALTGAGFVLSDNHAEIVVAGLDLDFSYATAKKAALLIRAGATFIGTNPDVTLPTPEGLIPGAGSILAMLEAAGGKPPLVIGKPEPAMFEVALRLLQTLPERTLMIGDRLDTDIFGAYRAGLKTALVLTGVSQVVDIPLNEVKPDYVFENLPALLQSLAG
jgi:4-nitrophenyl phosphatase